MNRRSFTTSVLALALGGCRTRRLAPGGGRVTVTFVGWGAPEESETFAAALTELEELKPHISVVYTQVPGVGFDYLNKLRLMLVAGLAPDVFYVPDGAFPEMVRTGALLDLEPFLRTSSLDLEAIWPSALERYRWSGARLHGGNLHALPKDLGPMVVFYNKDLLRRRRVVPPSGDTPMTWDEALRKWRALTFVERGLPRWGITRFPYDAAVWSSGGEILSPDARTWTMTTDVAVRAFQWCADLAIAELVAPDAKRLGDGAGGGELFQAGFAAMHVDGRWMVPRYRTLPFDWDVAPIPIPARDAKAVSRSGSVGLAISSRSRHPQEAFEVVEYLVGPRGQAKLTMAGFQLPNQRSVARTNVFLQPGKRPAHAEAFLVAAATSRPAAVTRTPDAFWDEVMSTYAEAVWRGDRTAADLFPEIAPRINQTLRAAFDQAGLGKDAHERRERG